MFHGFFLGILGGAAAAKFFGRRWRHRGGCGDGGCSPDGDCGRGRWGGGRWGGGPGRHGFGGPGFGGPLGLMALVRELRLSPEQWHQGQEIFRELRSALHDSRHELRGSLAPALAILAEPTWSSDRAAELAKEHDATFGRIRGTALGALERLHGLLTPEQRERLRRFTAAPTPQ